MAATVEALQVLPQAQQVVQLLHVYLTNTNFSSVHYSVDLRRGREIVFSLNFLEANRTEQQSGEELRSPHRRGTGPRTRTVLRARRREAAEHVASIKAGHDLRRRRKCGGGWWLAALRLVALYWCERVDLTHRPTENDANPRLPRTCNHRANKVCRALSLSLSQPLRFVIANDFLISFHAGG